LPNSDYSIDNSPHFEIFGESLKNEDSSSKEESRMPIIPPLKRIPIISIITIMLMVIFSSCTLEKRLYLSGCNVEWKKSKDLPCNNEVTDKKISKANEDQTNKCSINANIAVEQTEDNLIASVDNSNPAGNQIGDVPCISIKSFTESGQRNANQQEHPVVSDSCDIITLLTGVEISAKVLLIDTDIITYKECGELNGPVLSQRKADVFMVKYSNGAKAIIPHDNSNQDYTKSAAFKKANRTTEKFGVAGLIAAVVGLFVAGLPLGIAAVILGITSLTLINNHSDKYKGRGFAFVGVILGVIDVFLVMIFLASL
jgi:hypothetical protein